VMVSLTSVKALPIAKRAIDDDSAPETDSFAAQACTVELILYWKNAGMPDQEILTKCNAVKQP